MKFVRKWTGLAGIWLAGLGLVLLLETSPGAAFAQTNPADNPTKIADLVFTHVRPKIDGVLDDENWANATIIDDLHQTSPTNGGVPSQKTVFYLSYDRDALYIGIRVFETDPDKIVARQLIQGSSIRSDDRIQIILDPYMSKRSGYAFFINANGIQGEGLYDRPYQINPDWTGIWYGEANITDEGWVAEIEIPFKTISFDESLNDWGFSVARVIARNDERIAWTSRNRSTNPSSAGILRGVGEAQQGVGLDIVPSLAIKSKKINTTGHEHLKHVPSIDAYYKITPSLTASMTANTDFSGTDVDDVVVNLSRFSVYLPEKRGFFLQDADIFGFANVEENGVPFHTRKIGLDENGQPVDIVFGAKVSGRISNWNVGLLGVLQDSQPTVDQSELLIARASANVLRESALGFIATYGDPLSNEDNTLIGSDFVYRNTSLIKGKAVEGSIWYQVTQSDGEIKDSQAWGGAIGMFARDGFFGQINHKTLEENFNPALGFVNWTGIRQTEMFGGYRRRPSSDWVREVTHSFFFQNVKDMDGGLEFRILSLQPFEIITHANDSARLRIKNFADVIKYGFYISEDNFVGPGNYDYTRAELVVNTSDARRLSWQGEADFGGFFDGYRVRLFNEATWRPNKHLLFGAGLSYNDISLSDGDFITRLGTFRFNVAFNSKWALLNFVQYDNVSDTAAVNSRLRWQPKPGDEYVFVVNYGADIGEDGQIYTRESELILKASKTIRF